MIRTLDSASTKDERGKQNKFILGCELSKILLYTLKVFKVGLKIISEINIKKHRLTSFFHCCN